MGYYWPMQLTRRDARKLFLKQQGLLRDNEFGRGKAGLEKTIQRLSYLQIDTISVVNRAHEHIAATRNQSFEPEHLNELMQTRTLFEYWNHAAAFMPFEHYRFALPVMAGWRASRDFDQKLAREIMARIKAEGPLQSRDFEDTEDKRRGGWWEWKPAKQALEHLFFSGELMVTRRDRFQKVFDLRENVVPSNLDVSMPTVDEWCRHIARTMVDALGVATESDIGYARPTIRRLAKIGLREPMHQAIIDLVEAGELIEVVVDGATYYSRPDVLNRLPLRANRGAVKILSPFDNSVINRKRTQALFDFDYQLECYVPAAKRRYGYFSLPLLWGDELVGRMDAKADRKSRQLLIKHLAMEPDATTKTSLPAALARGIVRFMQDHDCDEVILARCTPAKIKSTMRAALKAQRR